MLKSTASPARHDARGGPGTGQRRPVRIDVPGREMLASRDKREAALVRRKVFEKEVHLGEQVRCLRVIDAEYIGQVGMKRTGKRRTRIEQACAGLVQRNVLANVQAQ